jgi:GT2 family glycosyltransferase
MNKPIEILLIVTCFNRKQMTLKFLNSLKVNNKYKDIRVHVFILDDASPDKTGEEVKEAFPEVEVLYGNGKLYWAGGVRLILEHLAEKINEYDGILFANDDIEFENFS